MKIRRDFILEDSYSEIYEKNKDLHSLLACIASGLYLNGDVPSAIEKQHADNASQAFDEISKFPAQKPKPLQLAATSTKAAPLFTK